MKNRITSPEKAALEALEHPKSPDFAYTFSFRDLLAKISAKQTDILAFIDAVANGKPSTKLKIDIDAIGVFTGLTRFDSSGQRDQYDGPARPGQTWFNRLPGVKLSPPLEESHYGVIDADDPNSVELNFIPGVNGSLAGRGLVLRGGSIAINGNVGIDQAPELDDPAYISSCQPEVSLWTPSGNGAGEDDLVFRSVNVLRLDRLYLPEPQFIDTPYQQA